MEFLTTKQKKKKAQRLYFGYMLLSVLIVLATYVLISTALGFEIFSSKGQVVQNGLLFVDSRPDGADIYINGNKESDKSNAKFALPEAEYSIQLRKDGFRDWDGKVSLMGGTVEFLTYPRLMPVVPALVTSRSMPSVPFMSQSRDKRWLASYYKESPTTIEVADLDKPKDPIVTLAISPDILAGQTVESLSIIEWAGDNEHFLVSIKLSGNPTLQYVLLHREKIEDVVNLSALFSLNPGDSVGLWDAKKDKFYIRQSSGLVLLGTLKDKAIASQPLFVDSTQEFFAVGGERAIYTTKSGTETLVKFYSNKKTYTITTMKDGTKPLIAKSFGFNRNDYILLAGEGFEKTLIYRNFEKTILDSTTGRVAPFYTMPAQSKVAETSRSNRFVMGSDSTNAQVYDIEQKELLRYELPTARPAQIGWLDDARLFAIGSDSRLSVFDFTGKNVYELASQASAIPYTNAGVSNTLYVTKDAGTYMAKVVDIESPTKN